MNPLKRLLQPPAIPPEYRANFIHLCLDIGWFGVLSGSTLNFLNVYATRLGASGFQIGLLGAISAIISLIFAIPAGRWLEKHTSGRAVFWSSVLYRLGFLLLIPLPWLFNAQGQIWAIILVSLFMGIPLVALSVGFSTLFAEAVPSDWRAYVAGLRNVVLSVAFMLTSLGSGYLLDRITFPLNYQVIFLIGCFGAAMSSFHLYFIRPLPNLSQPEQTPHQPASPINEPASTSSRTKLPTATASAPALPQNQAVSPASQPKARPSWLVALRIDIWKTPFRTTLLVLLFFHFGQYLALPIFPLYNVRVLGLSDENLGIGTALFYLTVLLGSTQLNRLVTRGSHKAVIGWGVLAMALYPILLAFSSRVWHFYGVSIVGGSAWALVGGASINYILENTPENDRPAHLAWYNIVLNASVLTGSLIGPAIADQIGLPQALILAGILRGLAGLAILKWG